jgi:hypothetical protein
MLLTGWHMIKRDRYFQLLLTVNKTGPTTVVTFFVGYKDCHPMSMMICTCSFIPHILFGGEASSNLHNHTMQFLSNSSGAQYSE